MTPGRSTREFPNRPRIAVLTSIETRHRYFANAIRCKFDLAALLYAPPVYMPAAVDDTDLTPDERAIVAEHFTERARQEQAYFGHDCEKVEPSATCPVIHIEPGQMNTKETTSLLDEQKIDTVLVFGTDLIKPPLLAPDRRLMINMHLGLSPYYRGTATNFYPLLNGEPQYVGATIHILDAGIDTGPILQHARPTLTQDDRPHTIGCKAIAAGTKAMIAVVTKRVRGETLEGVPQWRDPRGRVYFRRDYHPRQVVELYRKWGNGLKLMEVASHDTPPKMVGDPCHFSAARPKRTCEPASYPG